MIFIDADAYIGIYWKKDVHRQRAVKLAKQIEARGEDLCTSWDVIDEAATKLSYLTQKVTAARFLKDRTRSDERIIYATEKLAKTAVKIFLKQSSKRVSLTDCLNMVIARELGITVFFSFDKHYEQNGFELLK